MTNREILSWKLPTRWRLTVRRGWGERYERRFYVYASRQEALTAAARLLEDGWDWEIAQYEVLTRAPKPKRKKGLRCKHPKIPGATRCAVSEGRERELFK